MRRTGQDILFVSNAGWHYALPTNRQQLPPHLAKKSKVLYSSPFSFSQVLVGTISIKAYRPGLREQSENLFLFDNLQLLPLVRRQIWPFRLIDRWLVSRAIKKYSRALGLNEPILWLYFPPSYKFLLGEVGEILSCYHCTDDHAGQARVLGDDHLKMAEEETALIQAVDMVFTTSRPLYEQKIQLNPNTFLMPNVADIEHFAPVARGEVAVAAELDLIRRPVAGFIGAVSNYKVDLGLIERVAALLPGWSFVFVGPVGSIDGTGIQDLPRLPNIHYLGRRPFESLPAYIAGFDVCTIPYRLNSYTTGVFPLKFWEYLAAGKAVVTTPLPALEEYSEYVEVAGTPDVFADALVRSAESAEDPYLVRTRSELAAGHSWEKQAQDMIEVINSFV